MAGERELLIDRSIKAHARSGAKDLLRAESGATAVEFAFVAAPFLALLYAILETALVFFAQQVLQTATTQAARAIMTGQAQSQSMTATQFQQSVCTHATTLFNCSNVYVTVNTFSSFSSVSMPSPIQNGKFSGASMSYSPGGPGDIEIVQVYYPWPVFSGPLGFALSNTSNGNDVLIATAAFRNEP